MQEGSNAVEATPEVTLNDLKMQLEAQNKLIGSLMETVEQLKISTKQPTRDHHGVSLRQALQAALNAVPEPDEQAPPTSANAAPESVRTVEAAPTTVVVNEKRLSAVDEAFEEFHSLRAKR